MELRFSTKKKLTTVDSMHNTAASVALSERIGSRSSSRKTVRKGPRSSARQSKAAVKPVAGRQQDAKTTKKDPAENHGVSILGQTPSVETEDLTRTKRRLASLPEELLPLKKRRLVFPSTSTPQPDTGDTLSSEDSLDRLSVVGTNGPKSLELANIKTDAVCCSMDHDTGNLSKPYSSLTPLTQEKAATSPETVNLFQECLGDSERHSKNDGSHDTKRNLLKRAGTELFQSTSPSEKVSDSIALSLEKADMLQGTTSMVQEGSALSDSISDPEFHTLCAGTSVNFKEEGERDNNMTMDDLSRLENTNSSLTSQSPACDFNESKICMKSADMSAESHEEIGLDARKVVSSRKTNRLNWDLNKVMESWDLPDDDCVEEIPHTDEPRATLAKLETREVSNNLTLETTQFELCSGILLDPVASQMIVPETNSMQSEGISPLVSLRTCSYETLDVENPENILDDLSALSGTSFEGQPIVAVGMEESDTETRAPGPAQKDDFIQVQPEQIPNFCHIPTVEDCDKGSHNSDVSQGSHGHTAGVSNRRIDESGYESPIEDGELRELDALAPEEDEVGSETECVDYEIDDKDAEELDAPSHCVSETASEICQTVKGNSSDKPADYANGLIVKSSSAAEVKPTEETRRKVFRQPDEQLYSSGLQGERNTNLQRDGYMYDPSFHSGKVFGYRRPIRSHQVESQGGRQWVGSRENSRKYPPTGNEYPLDYKNSHTRSFNADGKTQCFQRELVHNPSNKYGQPFVRRSSSDKDNCYSMEGRAVDGRHRRHFRPVMYQQGVSRGPRDEYGPMCDSAQSSVQQPHYTARREQSFSPDRDSMFSHPRRRSGSRSPLTCDLQRDRSMRVSPQDMPTNFITDPKRMSVRKTSPPRRQFSPPCNNRWRDERKHVDPNFRGRKMSGRLNSPERLNSGDCYRSTTRPGRFTEMSGGRGRGRGYHTSGIMKFDDIYELPQRPVPRRFNYGAEDCSEKENEGEQVRGTYGREVPQVAMEDRGPP